MHVVYQVNQRFKDPNLIDSLTYPRMCIKICISADGSIYYRLKLSSTEDFDCHTGKNNDRYGKKRGFISTHLVD